VPKYDLAVVGAGLGGLAVTALISRKNMKAIIIEPGKAAGGALRTFEKGGFVFATGPALSFGFERGGAIQDLYEKLGVSHNASLLSPCYQVALPDRRITVYAEQGETLEELKREFPDEIDVIARFYRDLKKKSIQNIKNRFFAYLSSRRSAGGFIRRYKFSRELIAFLDVQSRYFFSQPIDDISLASLITLCNTAPLMVQGGFKKIVQQMVEVLLKNGCEIKYHVPLAGIAFNDKRRGGITTPQGFIESAFVLLNTEQQQREHVLFMGIRDEVVPVGMLANVIGLTDYSFPERFFALTLSDPGDETVAPKGTRALTASFQPWFATQSQDELMRVIGGLIPFLNKFLVISELYKPESRRYDVPEDLSFKPVRAQDRQMLLSRSSMRGVYMLLDGTATPAQSIAAARTLVERIG
jgi:hypothetical protein